MCVRWRKGEIILEGMHVADIRATISILLIVGVHVGHVWDQGETD